MNFEKWTTRRNLETSVLQFHLCHPDLMVWLLLQTQQSCFLYLRSLIEDYAVGFFVMDTPRRWIIDDYFMTITHWRSLVFDYWVMITLQLMWSLLEDHFLKITSWRYDLEGLFLKITSWRLLLEDHFLKITYWRSLLDNHWAIVTWRLSILEHHSLISLFHDHVLVSCCKSLWYCVVEQHQIIIV